ncbi:TldD protein [Escherichia coli]|uniref:TldD protein n=1 Tax=Escherichia coli TaxID=562 RepID=A0A376TR14_ECOLX|nr:TldD protein [Escherichia coli]
MANAERGASGGGGRFGYEFFLADLDGEVRADAWAKEAVRMALGQSFCRCCTQRAPCR